MALNDILFVGDIHGSMSDTSTAFETAARHGIDTIVQVGDFWLYSERELTKMERVQHRVEKQFGIKVQLHFIDGNHEDYHIINPHLEDTTELAENLLYYHPRGTIFTVKDVTIGCFGGAISIDKDFRKPGKSWFDDEKPTMSDTHRAKTNFKNSSIDVLITHDVPDYALSQVKYTRELDSYDAVNLRHTIGELSVISKSPVLIHGHWHHYAQGLYNVPNEYNDELIVNVISLNRNCHYGSMITLDNTGHNVNIISD